MRRTSHAYIVASPAEDERLRAAARLAAELVCASEGERPCGSCRHCKKAAAGVHPDIITVERETDSKGKKVRELRVDQIRRIIADAYIKPNEAERKVYLLPEADSMNISAQNALLKLLEEPPGGVCLILCAENSARLSETVVSRCQELSINAETETDIESRTRAEEYLRILAGGDEVKLLRLTGALGEMKTDEMSLFAASVRSVIADILCGRAKNPGLDERALLEKAALMQDIAKYSQSNVGVKHICGLLSVK